jgi:hypothetical protein
MPQNVPKIEWTDDALRVRQLIFEFWAEHKRPPNLREVHEALDLDRRQILQAYKLLELGIIITVHEDTQNGNLLKAPPFSAYPSQVAVYVDDEFHSFAGCASESIAFSHMPPFEGKDVRLESYCVCCLEPITITSKSFEVQSATPDTVLMHVSLSPYDWNNVDMVTMCDSMNFVIDAEHAERFERQSSRRGILCDLDQTKKFVTYTADQRMWDYHWPSQTMAPEMVITMFQHYGVDTSAWDG